MIETNRLLLIPVDLGIIDSLLDSNEAFFSKYRFFNDGSEYLNPSPEYLHKIKQRLIDHPEEYPFAVDYLIIIKDIKTVIGTIYFKSLPDKEKTSEIGYGMTPKYEGNGYMSEALTAMISFAKERGLSSVTAETHIDNVKSQNLLIRCGFSRIKIEENKLLFQKIL